MNEYPDSLGLCGLIKSDFRQNRGNWKGFLLLFLYRIAHGHLTAPVYAKPFSFAYIIFYKLLTELVIGSEIHWRCHIGPGARIYHGYGLVINSGVHIGSSVILRNGVTIGMKSTQGGGVPRLGNDVDIGASAIIIGPVFIGDGAVIGAGAVVIKDVPQRAIMVGNPARVLRIQS